MRSPEFFLLFLDNPGLYFVILFLLSILFIYLFKKYRVHIIDPFFLAIVGCVFAYVVPFFLFFTGNCPIQHFTYFCISESLFWVMFLLTCKPTKFKRYHLVNEMQYARLFFKINVVIYVVSSLLTYLYVGVALFLEHRQELLVEASSGSGLLGRFSGFSALYILYYTYHMIFRYHKYRYSFFIFLVVVNSILSGSKGAVLALLISYFIYVSFYLGKIPHVKKKYFLLLLLVPIFILMTYGGSDSSGFLLASGDFLYRFMAFGDTYWYAYPNNTIEKVEFVHPFATFFQGLLGPFRLIDYNSLDKSIGIQLFWAVEPSATGTITGPNARTAVMGWSFFGWMGLAFSAFCGWLMGFLMYRVRKHFIHSFLSVFVFGYLYQISVTICTDFSFFLNSLSSFLINLFLYGGLLLLMTGFNIKYKKDICVVE